MTCLAMMSACRDFESDRLVEQSVGDCYINIAIAVSGGNTHTRADEPKGGEDGDGREAGFERENTVTGITLILYQDDAGINTSDNPALDLVRYFHVSGREIGTDPIEVTYTTGQQNIGRTLDYTKSYRAIVIANANLEAELKNKKLDDVRNYPLSTVYYGTPMSPASSCSQFVMSSESDVALTFGTPKNLDGTTYTKGQDMYFDLTSQPITIERMAARIDFSTKYSTEDKVNYDATKYNRAGYVYRVWNAADEAANTAPSNAKDANRDHFVVVSITPFNVSDGNTYPIKRIADDGKTPSNAANVTSTFAKRTTAAYVPRYLDDETATSWVLDSYSSADKNAEAYPSHIKGTLDAYKTQTSLASSPYNLELKEEWHDVSSNYFDLDGYETFIVSYPKENTIDSDSPLYYYATGVAIEGIYYTKGTTTGGTPKVYYGFLRHQGESDAAYDAFKLEGKDAAETTSLITAAKAMKCNASKAMNFGVVRNNIYRISIDRITEQGTLELKIKVKKWDPYIHEYIYM